MKTRILFLAAFLGCIFLTQNLDAQVTSVNYQLKYDTTLCRYDAYIIINAGSATTAAQRIQFNAQYTIVVPAGDTIVGNQIISHMPLQGNTAYDGTTPLSWLISTVIKAPAAAPSSNFYSITPTLSPTARYNNLSSGDTVKIFSFAVSSMSNCGSGIRIFQNGSDPNSAADGMEGSDFSNGFTIGSALPRYNANSTQLHPPSPLVVNPPVVNCGNGIEIDLTASTTTCQSPLTYAWTGPNSYTSTTQDVSIIPSTTANAGLYKVVVTDALGCKDSITVNADNKPNAGPDSTICAGTSIVLSGTSPTTGTWAPVVGNPAGASMGALPNGQVNITFTNAASGAYTFRYSTPSCSDDVVITVNPKPAVSITGLTSICVGSTTQLSPSSGGTWSSSNNTIASVDNSGLVTANSQGSATFTFTNTSTGCSSTTAPVTVNPKPTTAAALSTICIGSTTNLTPNMGGTWVSSDPTRATVTNTGVVTAVSAGPVTFTFTETLTGCVGDPVNITISVQPTALITGNDSICVLATTTLSPTTGGTWASSNNTIATVSNSGVVTGLSFGRVVFRWTETLTGCVSTPTDSVTVMPAPTVSITGPTIVCVGVPSQLSPAYGGTWTSNNPSVATVALGGIITAVSQGSATFTFVDSISLCSATTGPLVVNPPPTVSAGSTSICIGTTTTLSPSIGGTWAALNPLIASRVGNVVTGVSAGDATFRFTESGSGCTADVIITVNPRPLVTNPAAELCVGFTTNVTPATGGTWQSSNPAIATVNNSGLVTAVGVGSVTFTFTSTTTLCPSLPTAPLVVKNQPVVSITGPTTICVGQTSQLSPSSGGTWTSSNTAVATVSNTGLVTSVGPGVANFTYTETTSGCISAPTGNITVSSLPVVSFTGPNNICIGQTTTLSPTSGGTWVSSAPSVASVTNAGLVTGISAGPVTFTFTQTSTGCTSTALNGTVSPKPTVAITGDTTICIGGTTTLSPTSGGAWSSSNPAVATITSGGVITGVGQGTVIFTFISDAGCASDPIISIAIMPNPTVLVTGPSNICIGATTQLSPTSGGTWTSTDPSVASVTSGGLVAGLTEGTVQFIFTSTLGCVSIPTSAVTVSPKPLTVLNGPNTICVGKTSNISPTIGGTWVSSNPAVATISNSGIITGMSPGTVRFVFTNTTSGCVSDSSAVVTITAGPTVSGGGGSLCITGTRQLTPSSGGTWVSNNPSIATVSPSGLVTAVSQGQATFTFTDVAGCSSQPTSPITVNPRPTVSIAGLSSICIGGTTQLSPASGGTWVSNNPGIATVDINTGLVTGIGAGQATFVFTDAAGCQSLATLPVTVTAAPIVSITGPTTVCVNGTTTLSPSSGGTWSSSNPSVATVNNFGVVTAVGPGTATFTFIETATGCQSSGATDPITVTHCFNPDFNATFVNVSVPGDVSTNDYITVGTSYGTPVYVSSPSGSVPVINMLSDGTYTFITDKPGVYRYEVPVCIPPMVSGCPRSDLTITVSDHLIPTPRPFANVDFATTSLNTPVTLLSLANDGCVVVTGCTLDAASVTIITAASHGGTAIDPLTGDITYTPNTGFTGIDSLRYQVCVSLGNCATAKQFITVNAAGAANTTVAADDFAVTPMATAVSGNVKTNDSDPQGDLQTVTAYTSTVPGVGTLVLASNGSYTFTPVNSFSGPIEFIYTTTDDNVSPATAKATLHILVVPDLIIKVRAYLEGALMNNANATASDGTGRPLMRDNLRVSPFQGSRYIPDTDPYRQATSYLNVTSKFTKVAPGNRSEFLTIAVPDSTFKDRGQNSVVDWVFIELRSKSDSLVVSATRSGLIQRDGDVVDIDGTSGLRFPGIAMDNYFVVVRHHRHLGVMSKRAQTPLQLTTLVNFTTTALETFDHGTRYAGRNYSGLAQKPGIALGYVAMWAGDFDANGKVKVDNPGDDMNTLFGNVFSYPNNISGNSNYDFGFGYLPGDYDMNSKAKFDNPSDDKNMLYGQLLFYPLNTGYLSNYDFFIEQLPKP